VAASLAVAACGGQSTQEADEQLRGVVYSNLGETLEEGDLAELRAHVAEIDRLTTCDEAAEWMVAWTDPAWPEEEARQRSFVLGAALAAYSGGPGLDLFRQCFEQPAQR
jgi:hypothetical protein